jgi:predicted metal-dependent hydrolase
MYPEAYIDYLVHFHGDRDYFECHEVLEEYWKEDERGQRKVYWVAFIQIAVSLYHQRRGNFSGSLRMMKNAISILKNEKEAVKMLGLHYEQLIVVLEKRKEEIESHHPYTSIFLPIQDESLLNECKVQSQERGIVWGNTSNLSDTYLINKHSLRDRVEVIEEREKQKALKKRTLD